VTSKKCYDCSKVLPVSEFYKNSAREDGLGVYCKKCEYARQKKYRAKHPKKTKNKRCNEYLKRTYGLTLEEYDQMVAKQKNRCAICGKPESRSIKGAVPRLGIDHNHKTGEIRELLCYSCNLALGYANDDPELLRRMIAYLEKHN